VITSAEHPDTSGAGEDEGDVARENQNQSNQSNQSNTNDVAGENQNQSNQSNQSNTNDVAGENKNQSNTSDVAPPPDESDRDELRRSHRLKLKAQRIMRQ